MHLSPQTTLLSIDTNPLFSSIDFQLYQIASTKMIFQPKSIKKINKTQLEQNIDDMEKYHSKISAAMPLQALPEISFDRSNPHQNFYRMVEKVTESNSMIKLGWKIVCLKRQQQDLGLFCLGLLQAQAKFPLKIFTTKQPEVTNINTLSPQGTQQVWMEANLLRFEELFEEQGNFELKVFQLCQSILPLVQNFVDKYLNWSYMSTKEFQDVKVIKLFQKEVILPINHRINNHRINICGQFNKKKH